MQRLREQGESFGQDEGNQDGASEKGTEKIQTLDRAEEVERDRLEQELNQLQKSNEADINDIKIDSEKATVDVRPSTTGVELGRRLGRHQSQISRWKANPDELERRTRELDPDAIAWRYDTATKLYYPIQ